MLLDKATPNAAANSTELSADIRGLSTVADYAFMSRRGQPGRLARRGRSGQVALMSQFCPIVNLAAVGSMRLDWPSDRTR